MKELNSKIEKLAYLAEESFNNKEALKPKNADSKQANTKANNPQNKGGKNLQKADKALKDTLKKINEIDEGESKNEKPQLELEIEESVEELIDIKEVENIGEDEDDIESLTSSTESEDEDEEETESENENTESPFNEINKKTRGTRVSKEYAEREVSNSKKEGFHTKIIIHKQIVDANGNKITKASMQSAKSMRLVCKDTGEIYDIDRDYISIGKDANQDIVIDEKFISRIHASIEKNGKDYYLKDQGSTNGTFLNNRKIKSVRIKPGDTIKFANIVYLVEEV